MSLSVSEPFPRPSALFACRASITLSQAFSGASGPLMYHFDDNREGPSLELSYEELRRIITLVGFTIVEEKYPLECPYICNPASMMQMRYQCALLVAQKPASEQRGGTASA